MSAATFRRARSPLRQARRLNGRLAPYQRRRGKPASAAATRKTEIRRDPKSLGDPCAGACAGARRDRRRSPAALRWRQKRQRDDRSTRRKICRAAGDDRDRRDRDVAAACRQRVSNRNAREDAMSDANDALSVLEQQRSKAETFGIPLAVLAELTHRCPLLCPYCSNPLQLDRGSTELTTAEWKKVLSELAEIGVLQVHFSGGEPTARKDLVELAQHASDVGLYTNLITSAVLLTREKLAELADAGLCHVQISFQGTEQVLADRVAGSKGAHHRKIEVARWTRELDLPLTVNAVMHRQNLHQLPDIIQMAVDLDADRLEV